MPCPVDLDAWVIVGLSDLEASHMKTLEPLCLNHEPPEAFSKLDQKQQRAQA